MADIYEQLESCILLLDGGFGTMVQQYGLTEEDYRGERFREWPALLKGCNDLLALTRPEAVREIHVKYLQAGADIIETDSFNANAVSLADYGLEAYAYEMSRAAAAVARSAADEFTARNPQKPRFVAGSMGPTNRTASMSADVANPAAREVTFAQLVEAYTDQARGLLDGGADILLVETIFDTLNAKAALYAIDALAEKLGRTIRVMASGTLADASGRTLSGQTVEAFCTSLSHAQLLSLGLNCAYGAKQLLPYLNGWPKRPRSVSRRTPTPDFPTSWAATTRPRRCSPRTWANTCAADWSISSADAAARRPRISSNFRKSPATMPRAPFRRRAASRR